MTGCYSFSERHSFALFHVEVGMPVVDEHRLKGIYLEFDDGSVFKVDMETVLKVNLLDELGPDLNEGMPCPIRYAPTWRKLKFVLEAERIVAFGTQIGEYIKGATQSVGRASSAL